MNLTYVWGMTFRAVTYINKKNDGELKECELPRLALVIKLFSLHVCLLTFPRIKEKIQISSLLLGRIQSVVEARLSISENENSIMNKCVDGKF